MSMSSSKADLNTHSFSCIEDGASGPRTVYNAVVINGDRIVRMMDSAVRTNSLMHASASSALYSAAPFVMAARRIRSMSVA
eukprot:CAMPEP_0174726282 /NCGR_PEP_ID=MMETSP1094-20130205/47419_1 /TAXON_ID=156173 /ORGANISM="Chrysochromulina brevifilum, Strain UTEX LB 985" /LENGTH=80 /DNA_ID=CAMNT_0015927823 /DNA_START=37 /DNA_END=275 /DNA_ORIENTATION=+